MAIDVYSEYKPLPWQIAMHAGDWRHACLPGAKGSGKSRAGIEELKMCAWEYPGSAYLIGRKTLPSLKDTTLREFLECTPDAVIRDYNKSDRNVTFINGSVFMFRPLDEEKKFDSLKLSGFLIDEADEIDKGVYDTLKSRMRQMINGRPTRYRSFLLLNPCEEDHWIPQLFLYNRPDDHALFHSSTMENMQNLPPDYVDQLKSIYSEDMQQRMIYGMFGKVHKGRPVFPQFSRGNFIRPIEPTKGYPIYRGIDFGFNHPVCVWLQFINGQARILAEKQGRKVYLDDFIRNEIFPYQLSLFGDADGKDWEQYRDFCDPRGSDESDKGKSSVGILNDHGIYPIYRRTYIEEGLKAIKQLLDTQQNGEPNFLIHARCRNLIEGFKGGYHRLDGEESPEKDNVYDNCFAAEILVTSENGAIPISDIRIGDRVLTRQGLKRVYSTHNVGVRNVILIKFSNGVEITCTPDHKFWTENRGWISADALRYDDNLVSTYSWLNQSQSSLMESPIDDTRPAEDHPPETISDLMGSAEAQNFSIASCGRRLWGRFLRATMSTIRTVIRPITGSRIWNALVLNDTWDFTQMSLALEQLSQSTLQRSIELDRFLKNGTLLKRDIGGTSSTPRQPLVKMPERRSRLTAPDAQSHLRSTDLSRGNREISSAAITAGQPLDGPLASMTKIGSVPFARVHFESIDTKSERPAPGYVRVVSSRRQSAQRVYDISVEDAAEFFANGILVSNCMDAMRYPLVHLTKRAKFAKAQGIITSQNVIVNPHTGRRREI